MRNKIRQRITDLRHERDQVWERMKAMSNLAVSEGRDLTASEYREYEGLEADLLRKGKEMERLENEAGLAPEAGQEAHGAILRGYEGPSRALGDGEPAVVAREQRLADWQAGRPTSNAPTALGVEEAREVRLDRVLGGWITGRRHGLNEVEQRVLSEGVDAAGGFTVPEILGASLIDRARNAARVIQAGATTVPVESDRHSIARLSSGVTGAWRAENAAISESDPAFERVTFEPKSHAVLTRLSRELAEDMIPEAFDGVTNELGQAIGLALDLAALRGSGTGSEPTGIRNQSGVTIQLISSPDGATPTDYDHLIDAAAAVQGANIEPTGFLYSSRTAKTYAKFKDANSQPLQRPSLVGDLGHFVTNQIPDDLTVGASNDTSEVYCGHWPDCMVGVRSNLRLEVLRERYADQLQLGLIAHIRADIQLAHSESFTVVTGIRP